MMQKNNHADHSHDHKGQTVPKLPAGNSADQLRASTVAKAAHIKEAGLGGNRTGEVSAEVQLAQAHRDAETESETIPASAPTQASPDAEQPETRPVQVQVNTGHNIHGGENLDQYIQDTVSASLSRFGRQVTRFEVHLRDDNGKKSNGDDKRCLLEARPAGMQPVAVTAVAATIEDALDDAVDKMASLLKSTFEKLHDPKGHTSLGEAMTL